MQLPDWSKRLDHLKRSIRYSGDTDILPEWANEAYADPDAAIFDPDYASISGRSVRTIGYSKSADFLITVITLEDNGTLWGLSAWKSNESDTRSYEEES
ncbi:MAG: hypothetical protein LBL67_03420 [Coriobacteriales bacterium]|jgi:uncharacterized DUF497 family protein|nr:hypothetical protein [Coriobacteriales bacterium]